MRVTTSIGDLPCRCFEHVLLVPHQEGRRRPHVHLLRRQQPLPVVPQLTLLAAVSVHRVLAEDDPVLGGLDRERAQVEQLVVQRAQGQAVGFDVGVIDVVPPRLRRA